MPQMAPLHWLILLALFTLTFLMLNTLNYFAFKYEIKSLQSSKKLNKTSWKW